MNKEQWWSCVNNNWADILELIHSFWINKTPLTITAPAAEQARQYVAESLVAKKFDYELLKANQDDRLADFLESLYWAIPESAEAHRYRGFGVLCDLCSESYCLFIEAEEAERKKEGE